MPKVLKSTLVIILVVLFISTTVPIHGNTKTITHANNKNQIYGYGNEKVYLEFGNFGQKVVTYINGEKAFESYQKFDGNIYTSIGGTEILSAIVDDSYYSPLTNQNIFTSKSAPAGFYEVSSSYLKGITITTTVIERGVSAVKSAILGYMSSKAPTTKLKLLDSFKSMVNDLATFIVTKGKTYNSKVKKTTYYYGGCDWLVDEVFYFETSRHSTEGYYWRDNPQLGVAPYTCKVINNKYPYH